jgi:DNA-binding HxlR family transcriptional regulator
MPTWPGTSVTFGELERLVDLLATEFVVGVILTLAAGPLSRSMLRGRLGDDVSDESLDGCVGQLISRDVLEVLPDAVVDGSSVPTGEVGYRLTEAGRALVYPLAAMADWCRGHEGGEAE